MTTHRTQLLTLDEVAKLIGSSRHTVDRVERRALGKIINAILEDEKIRHRYDGDLVAVSKHTCEELNITLPQWVKLASKSIIKRYWTI